MRHFQYRMKSEAPAPAGDGDTGTWFSFYKWNIEDENFVPRRQPFLPIEAGDFLWFVMDGVVKGGVPVLRVELPSLPHQQQEIWYDPRQGVDFHGASLVLERSLIITAEEELPEEIGSSWMSAARKRS